MKLFEHSVSSKTVYLFIRLRLCLFMQQSLVYDKESFEKQH